MGQVGNHKGPKVLLVDDHEKFRMVTASVLEEGGCEVQTASNGQEALEKLVESPPDVLILDVSMPSMSGFDLCHIIKRDERFKHIPVMFLSAFGAPEDYRTGHEAGGVVYMVKPYKHDRLLNIVRMLAGHSWRAAENETKGT
jgi:CheY-like chemotaxis protein